MSSWSSFCLFSIFFSLFVLKLWKLLSSYDGTGISRCVQVPWLRSNHDLAAFVMVLTSFCFSHQESRCFLSVFSFGSFSFPFIDEVAHLSILLKSKVKAQLQHKPSWLPADLPWSLLLALTNCSSLSLPAVNQVKTTYWLPEKSLTDLSISHWTYHRYLSRYAQCIWLCRSSPPMCTCGILFYARKFSLEAANPSTPHFTGVEPKSRVTILLEPHNYVLQKLVPEPIIIIITNKVSSLNSSILRNTRIIHSKHHGMFSVMHVRTRDEAVSPMRIWVKVIHVKCPRRDQEGVQMKQVKEEEEAEPRHDLRQKFSLSLIPWRSQECRLHCRDFPPPTQGHRAKPSCRYLFSGPLRRHQHLIFLLQVVQKWPKRRLMNEAAGTQCYK